MRKKSIQLGAVAVLMAACMIGCGSKQRTEMTAPFTYNKQVTDIGKETKKQTVIVVKTKAPATTPISSETPEGNVQKEEQTPMVTKKAEVKDYKSMEDIMTTISLYMAEGRTYDPEDEECYYSIMYMLGNNVAYKCGVDQFQEKGERIYVGKAAMENLSVAAFADHTILGVIPVAYEDRMQVERDKEQYRLEIRDPAEAYGQIQKVRANEDGSYRADFSLFTDEGEEIGVYEFTLLENNTKYAAMEPGFQYRIKSVRKMME